MAAVRFIERRPFGMQLADGLLHMCAFVFQRRLFMNKVDVITFSPLDFFFNVGFMRRKQSLFFFQLPLERCGARLKPGEFLPLGMQLLRQAAPFRSQCSRYVVQLRFSPRGMLFSLFQYFFPPFELLKLFAG
ncbi:hypothetical protein LR69_02693 [Geobacillus sp. BCO2]|nr:hypothetical protein LR69_02693 [Geobacillus sp. BCO2]